MAERRYTVLLYAAVITAVVATYGVYRVLQHTRAGGQVAMRPVVVAAKDLPEGAALSGGAVAVKEMPASTLPAGAYSSVDSVIGRVVRVPVFAGEVIVPGRLAAPGTGPGLEVKITPGKRAMAVRINDVAGISGLLQPNSRVDVVVTVRAQRGNAEPLSKVFMENVRVLSVGTTVQRDADGKPIQATTAALEVTPEESERLAVAANEGTVQLVLRAFADGSSVMTSGARTSDVLRQLNSAPSISVQGEPTAARRSERPARRRVVTRESGEVRLPPPPPPIVIVQPPPKPDSTTVQVFRGTRAEPQRFPTTQTTTPQRP